MSIPIRSWYWVVNDTNPTTQVFSSGASPPGFVANNAALFLTWLADPVGGAPANLGATNLSIVSAADNGGGFTRLTVNSTAPMQTSQFYNVGANGNQQITVVDSTNVDLLGLAFGSYIATPAMYGASVIDTLANLYALLGITATINYRPSASTFASSANVTLTNAPPKVANVTLTGAATKVILPPANSPDSVRKGDPLTINNLANDRTIGVYANDGTTLVTSVDRGGSGSVSLRDNSTTNGTWITNVDINRLTQNFTGVGNTDYQILNTDKVVGSTALLTVARGWTLPRASEVNPAQPITIGDFFGAVVPPLKVINVGPFAGSGDTVNGSTTAISINQPFGSYICWSNGTSAWTMEYSNSRQVQAVYAAPGAQFNNNTVTPTIQADCQWDTLLLQDRFGNTLYRNIGSREGIAAIDLTVVGVGGRDQAGALSGTAYLYVIGNLGGTISGLWSNQIPSVGPTLPAGFTHFVLIGAVALTGGGNLPTFSMREDYRTGGVQTVASAASTSLDIPFIEHYEITGTTTITSIVLGPGKKRTARFQGVLTLTNGANLVLPNATNITTAAGDWAEFYSSNGTTTRCVQYNRADGSALTGGTANAWTIRGNPTSGSAIVSDFLISSLTQKTSPVSTDLVVISDEAASHALKYVTVGSLTGLPAIMPGGRLTLSTATPVMTSTVTGATRIYFTPGKHQFAPIYDGSKFVVVDMGGEVFQDTTDATKSPSNASASTNYDMFAWLDGSTPRCTRGADWVTGGGSATARGTGASSAELQLLNGVWTNKQAISNGPAANKGTYVGTIRTNGSSTVDFIYGASASGGTAAVFNVWNTYNRVNIGTIVTDSGALYTYTTATIRQARASTGNKVTFLMGLQEDAAAIALQAEVETVNVANAFAIFGIGVDSTTVLSSPRFIAFAPNALNYIAAGSAVYTFMGLGSHFAASLEQGDGTNANFFDNSSNNKLNFTLLM